MGGVVAQALFTLSDFPPSFVSTIITLSSPLSQPVIAFDPILYSYYHNISEVGVVFVIWVWSLYYGRGLCRCGMAKEVWSIM